MTDDYPASEGWGLTYYLVKSDKLITITATGNGDIFEVSESAATTATWDAGFYSWVAKVDKSGEVHTVDSGTVEILTDYSQQSSGYDSRTAARIMLDNIETFLKNKDSYVANYSISTSSGSRALAEISLEELLRIRNRLLAEIAEEERLEDIENGRGDNQLIVYKIKAE